MNQKELNEIRRRIRLDRSSIHHIYGCYVNSSREIISYIDESMGLLGKEDAEKYLSLLKKALSGALGKNLMDISFATKQVMDSDEHRLLSALRKTELKDEQLRNAFYQCVINAINMDESNYVILLAHDSYDVPYRGKDGQFDRDGSDQVFSYILCSICPVKAGKLQFGYCPEESRFQSFAAGQIVSAPELGFMFPSFDDRAANIYNALFYSHDTVEIHQDFIDAVFRTPAPMSAGHQREAFQSALSQSLEQECSYDVVQSVHEQLRERIELHKESKDPEPLALSAGEMGDILRNSGMSEERIDAFQSCCQESFGSDAALSPGNVIDSRHFEIATPEVKISVDPKFSYLVQTKVIDGRKYILIAADSGVEVNGVGINITED